VTRSRESVSLRWPPEHIGELREFPTRALSPHQGLFRIVRIGNGPWWFGSSMAGRFDLPEPEGTCYLAADALAALMETIGPESQSGTVSEEFLRGRRLVRLHVPQELSLSDSTSRESSRFGMTGEIGTITPYDRPQAWAARLHAAGSAGIVYWLRHDPSRMEGFALFGPQGERSDWPWEDEAPLGIPPRLIIGLQEAFGIEVVEAPRRDQLRIIAD